jgi:hypothetical protein
MGERRDVGQHLHMNTTLNPQPHKPSTRYIHHNPGRSCSCADGPFVGPSVGLRLKRPVARLLDLGPLPAADTRAVNWC